MVVKLDLRDFFPSTLAARIEWYFRRIGWNAEAAALLTRWTTVEGGLPQGAPTSPRLSQGPDPERSVTARRFAVERSVRPPLKAQPSLLQPIDVAE